MTTPYATPRARALGLELRAARERRRLGVRELARLLGMTPGFVTNWERGLRLPKPEDIGAVLAHCRVIGPDRRRIVEMARGAREQDWIDSGGEEPYLEWERTAEAVFGWEPEAVPQLLQTSGYARALLSSSAAVAADEVDARVAERLSRRVVLDSGARCVLVLGETALHKKIGGAEAMAEQLWHLRERLAEGKVEVRVVPADRRPDLGRAFTIFDFADLPSIVHERLLRESASSSSPARVAKYREVAETLLELSLPKPETDALLESALRKLSVP
ncbi:MULTISPECIES: helix-turn-helix domain-containing protein [Amycolatopsis]|uniref:Helix-turn-helix transcriptional regulator n=1 Tax=Amycolatopsis dendrobii TaxID=2760662 RepID=A0A7W3VYW2_9PSEU|nr:MULTISPECIES: helix-turn-helix transcriptional regulator [Amycolatopsis]MBB1155763.1 helix-turn-helix transcriptional regulator [Amycolatopsis dendrobii]UKD52966.1 helix-turn-helix transcriptional regulator [Amycolatopsis sp. FU40]